MRAVRYAVRTRQEILKMTSKIWNFLVEWAESIHAARTAAALSRMGDYEGAKKVITKQYL
jgi:hypothetical protein